MDPKVIPYTNTITISASGCTKNATSDIGIRTYSSEYREIFANCGIVGIGCSVNRTVSVDSFATHPADAKKISICVDFVGTGDLYIDGNYILHESDPYGGSKCFTSSITSSKRAWYVSIENLSYYFLNTKQEAFSFFLNISY